MSNLRAIKADAEKASDIEAATEAIGVLTTEHRVTWARLREKLVVHNADNMAVVS